MLEALKKKVCYWLEGEVKSLVGLIFLLLLLLFLCGGAVQFFVVCVEGGIPWVMNASVLVLIVATTGFK